MSLYSLLGVDEIYIKKLFVFMIILILFFIQFLVLVGFFNFILRYFFQFLIDFFLIC